MLWVTVHNHCRVPPFGYLRVTGCLHLSVAYRSLPRPSSADIAKASTVRPYYLYLFCVIICAYRRRLTLDFALRTKVRGSFISLRLLDMHQMLTKISWLNTWEIILTCIRYIVVFCSRTFFMYVTIKSENYFLCARVNLLRNSKRWPYKYIIINTSMQFSKNKSADKFRVTRRCTCLAHLAYFQYASISQSYVRLD